MRMIGGFNSLSQKYPQEPPGMLASLAAQADVRFNGDAPWDIQVRDDRVYRRILTHGSLGFGEAYMDGMWECAALDELFARLLSVDAEEKLGAWSRIRLMAEVMRHSLFNLQSPERSFQVGKAHYDLGNDIFEAMLDPEMIYSCAYWNGASTLNEAQQQKLDLICRKLALQPGETLLEIGCGWGGLAQYAARHYGVSVHGITISREQQRMAQQRCSGLPVRIELIDYRKLQGQYDKIVSVGMFEHVGQKNYPIYFDTVHRLLKRDGLFLLHTIGKHGASTKTDPWIDKYIFPNGKLPAACELGKAVERRLIIEDWHNFGPDYDRTLMAWWENFDRAWPKLKHRYDTRFYRMWKYYLHCCAGFFRSRQGQLWQLVLSRRERRLAYHSVR